MEQNLKQILMLFKNEKVDLNNAVKYINSVYNNTNGKKLNINIYKYDGSKPIKVQLDLKFVANLLKGVKTLPSLNIEGLEGLNMVEFKNLIDAAIRQNTVGKIFQMQTEKGDIIKIYVSY